MNCDRCGLPDAYGHLQIDCIYALRAALKVQWALRPYATFNHRNGCASLRGFIDGAMLTMGRCDCGLDAAVSAQRTT